MPKVIGHFNHTVEKLTPRVPRREKRTRRPPVNECVCPLLCASSTSEFYFGADFGQRFPTRRHPDVHVYVVISEATAIQTRRQEYKDG